MRNYESRLVPSARLKDEYIGHWRHVEFTYGPD